VQLLIFGLLYLISVQSVSVTVPAMCGQPCTSSDACEAGDKRCGVCRLGVCVGDGNCTSYCDPNQDINRWCYNSYCTYCDKATNSCLSNCGGPCTAPNQCAHCTSCSSDFKCVRTCGTSCMNDNDCSFNVDGCTKCTSNTCQRPTGCGAPCTANTECNKNQDGCTKCVRGQCVRGGCGSICYYSPDCIDQGNCTQCFGRFEPGGFGYCTANCGSPCGAPEQCNGTLSNCGQCRDGVCRPSTQCGIACLNIAGCDGNCHQCIAGVCTANRPCGAQCDVDDICDKTTCPR